MARNYALLNRYGIKKYKPLRTAKSRNDIIIIMGPIGKFKPEGSRTDKWVGNSGMYYVATYKKNKNKEWVWGNLVTTIDRVGVAKLVGEARRLGKAIYYSKKGNMKVVGNAVRSDYQLNGSN